MFSKGDTVEIKGLLNSPQLNESFGTILGYDRKS